LRPHPTREGDFFIENLLVRIRFIIEMIRWTGLAPWGFEFPFPGSLLSTFLGIRQYSAGISATLRVFREPETKPGRNDAAGSALDMGAHPGTPINRNMFLLIVSKGMPRK